jgi:hypothetical protein
MLLEQALEDLLRLYGCSCSGRVFGRAKAYYGPAGWRPRGAVLPTSWREALRFSIAPSLPPPPFHTANRH